MRCFLNLFNTQRIQVFQSVFYVLTQRIRVDNFSYHDNFSKKSALVSSYLIEVLVCTADYDLEILMRAHFVILSVCVCVFVVYIIFLLIAPIEWIDGCLNRNKMENRNS